MTSAVIYRHVKLGAVSGLICGVVLYVTFFGIDSQLQVPPGTFYKMIGLQVGLDNTSAVVFGIISHLVTASLIGVAFSVGSLIHRSLRIVSLSKSILAGSVTGLEVFAIIFMPITIYVMIPTVTEYANSEVGLVSLVDKQAAQNLINQIDVIMWSALIFHIGFGFMLGLILNLSLYPRYKTSKKFMAESDKRLVTSRQKEI